jgi:protein involved in polysaccharide export with SLBB domain
MQRIRSIPLGALAWAVLLLAPPTSALAGQASSEASAKPPTEVMDPSPLRPGDILRLRIWREPDLSGDFPIDENGMATLPRLGQRPVTGVPVEQLRQQLVEEYRTYLNNPSIEITPLRRISVLGSVRTPGVYPVDPSITLGQAPNVAGGPLPESKHGVVELHRGGDERTIDLSKHPDLANLPLASGDEVYVPQRSWLSRNATWFVSTLVGVAGTTAIILTRH